MNHQGVYQYIYCKSQLNYVEVGCVEAKAMVDVSLMLEKLHIREIYPTFYHSIFRNKVYKMQ